MRSLLYEFKELLPEGTAATAPATPFATHEEYWLLLELKFALRSICCAAYRNFESVLMVSHQRGMINSKTAREAQARLNEVMACMAAVEQLEEERSRCEGGAEPYDLQLAAKLGLAKKPQEIFQLLTLMHTAKTQLFASQMSSYSDYSSPKKLFTDLCSIAKIDIDDFYHDDQQYVITKKKR